MNEILDTLLFIKSVMSQLYERLYTWLFLHVPFYILNNYWSIFGSKISLSSSMEILALVGQVLDSMALKLLPSE